MATATKQELQDELARLTAEQGKLWNEIGELQKKCIEIYNKKNLLQNELTKIQLVEAEDELAILFAAESELACNKLRSVVESYPGLTLNGVWSTTRQKCILFSLHRENDEKNKKTIEGLKRLLPYVKPVEVIDDDKYDQIIGGKPIGLFENTLGQHGVYHFYVMPNDEVILCFTRYGRPEFKSIGKFDDAMKYLQMNHWYESDELYNGCDDDDYY